MKSIIVGMVAAAGLMVTGAAMAADMPAAGKACLACHAVDKKVVGPAFTDVGAKYKGQADGASKIEANIKAGGQFGWKAAMKMPPKGGTNLTDADIHDMANFIAGLGH